MQIIKFTDLLTQLSQDSENPERFANINETGFFDTQAHFNSAASGGIISVERDVAEAHKMNPKDRTFSAIVGCDMPLDYWWGRMGYDMNKKAVNLARVATGICPININHDFGVSAEYRQEFGVGKVVSVDFGKLSDFMDRKYLRYHQADSACMVARFKLSDTDAGNRVMDDIVERRVGAVSKASMPINLVERKENDNVWYQAIWWDFIHLAIVDQPRDSAAVMLDSAGWSSACKIFDFSGYNKPIDKQHGGKEMTVRDQNGKVVEDAAKAALDSAVEAEVNKQKKAETDRVDALRRVFTTARTNDGLPKAEIDKIEAEMMKPFGTATAADANSALGEVAMAALEQVGKDEAAKAAAKDEADMNGDAIIVDKSAAACFTPYGEYRVNDRMVIGAAGRASIGAAYDAFDSGEGTTKGALVPYFNEMSAHSDSVRQIARSTGMGNITARDTFFIPPSYFDAQMTDQVSDGIWERLNLDAVTSASVTAGRPKMIKNLLEYWRAATWRQNLPMESHGPGEVVIPIVNVVPVAREVDERAAVAADNWGITSKSILPKRLAIGVDVGDAAILTSPIAREIRIIASMLAGIREKDDEVFLEGEAGGSGVTGLFNWPGVNVYDFADNFLTIPKLREVVNKLDEINVPAGRAWIMALTARNKARATLARIDNSETSSIRLWEVNSDTLEGERAYVSNHITKGYNDGGVKADQVRGAYLKFGSDVVCQHVWKMFMLERDRKPRTATTEITGNFWRNFFVPRPEGVVVIKGINVA